MSLPAGFLAQLALPASAAWLWLEIEGIAWAYSNVGIQGSFWDGRPAAERRLNGIKALQEVPRGVEQEVDPRAGTCTVGRLTVGVIDDVWGYVTPFLLVGSGRTDDWLRLSADLPASTADLGSLTVTGTPSAAAYPTGGGTFWVGRECFTYASRSGSVFSTVKRLMYRLPGQADAWAHTAGDIVSPYVRFLKTRRAALMLCLDGTDAGRVTRWMGTVSDVRLRAGMLVVDLDLDSVDAELGGLVFARQRRGKLLAGIADDLGSYDPADGEPDPTPGAGPGTMLKLDPSSLTGAAWTDGERVHVRVDDEYFSGRLSTAAATPACVLLDVPPGDARGMYGSAPAPHQVGAEVVEVLTVVGKDTNGPPEYATSLFTAGAHPLDLLLQLLLSRRGDGANGTYDVLPEGVGLGCWDQNLVDLAGVAALKRTWLAGERFGPQRLEEPTKFNEWMAGVLRPICCWPRVEGVFSIGRRNEPIPGLAVRALDATAIVDIPDWEAGLGTVLGRVVFRCDYDPANDASEKGPYRSTYSMDLAGPGMEAQEFYRGRWETEVIESDGHWSGLVAGLSTNADEVARRLLDNRRLWDSQPWPRITVKASLAAWDVMLGDLVLLSVDGVPNVTTGARGLSSALCVVLSKVPDEGSASIIFTLAHTGLRANNGRLMAPVATVASYAAGVVTVNAHDWSDASGQPDARFFAAGDYVRCLGKDLNANAPKVAGVVSAVSDTQVTLTGYSGTSPSAGDLLLLNSYVNQPAARRALSAFQSALYPDAEHTFVS